MNANYETLLDALTNEMQALHKELQECKEKLSQEPCGDCISREKVLQIIRAWFDREVTPSDLKNEIERLPSVTAQPKMGHCKDCKYFEYDSVAKVDGIPLIVAHEICKRWGDGCKSKEDGYCFLFEPQESEGKE